MIEVKNLVKIYQTGAGEFHALDNINLNIAAGDFVAIVGRSGAGKSTLLYQLGLLDHPSSGDIIIDGVSTSSLNSKDRTNFRLANLGYVFQDYALLPELTAIENILVPLLMFGYNKKEAIVLAVKALDMVGLKDKKDNLPSQMSGGQQQRVSIARAIANSPKILFADEPTANLDSETASVVIKVFKELNSLGQTIIMVTHENEYASETDKIIELKDGKIIS